MNREIKFRAYSDRIGMFNVDVLSITDGGWDCISITAQPHLKLMQYTGCTDKKGTEIYEGDIVSCSAGQSDIVYFQDGCFMLRKRHVTISHYENELQQELEVIGNIHENPELI